MIAVLDDPSTSANLLIELGYALAHDKKIMVILPRDGGTVPSDLVSTLYVRANPTDADAIEYNLDALLAAPAPKRRPYIPEKPETLPIGALADELLHRLSASLSSHDGAALEQVVVDALRASGVSIITEAQRRQDPGPDLGIWSDDLESSVGNPLIIEVKAQIPSNDCVLDLRSHVASYVSARNVEWGLVLYGDGPSRHSGELQSVPPVLFLQIGDLVERLRVEGFASIMSHLHSEAIRNG
jgi:hypothetical protein